MRITKTLIFWLISASLLLCGCTRDMAYSEETTAPPTSAVTETAPVPATQPTKAHTEPVFQLHSGIREDGSFDEGTLFIGDSLTNGLIHTHLYTNGLLGDARYMSIVGVTPQAFFTGPVMNKEIVGAYSPQFTHMLLCEAAAAAGDTVTAIYFMMGSNYSELTNAKTYTEILDYLLDHCPNATIYLQTIPYSESSKVHFEETNWYILEAYGTYAMDGNSRVQLLDAKHAIGPFLSEDGVHLSATGYQEWYEALLAYAEDNEIPQ